VYAARVVRVFDGDTVWVQPDGGGRWRKLRLDAVDAPEICQAAGLASRDALSAQLLDRAVTVRQRAVDAYGRGVARIDRGDSDMNAWLVRSGWAWASRWRGRGAYVAQEKQARANARGLWAAAEAPEDPRDFRRRHGPCEQPARAASVRR
jgi:micrococcal nuclease